MKKIGIDARLYSQTGVGTYLRNLLRELSLLESKDIHYYLYILPEDRNKIKLDPDRFTLRDAPFKWHTLDEQMGLMFLIRKDRLDLMHFTYFGYPVLYGGKFIATVHDLTPLNFKTGKASTKPSFFYRFKHMMFRFVLNCQIRRASRIITPTKAVKDQLVKRYGISIKEKIEYIYEGVGYELKKGEENVSLKNKYKEPFFIYVGNFYPHKNIEQLIRAYSNVKEKYQLILIGPKDFFSDSIKGLIQQLHLEQHISFFHNATTEDLIFFYKNAKALIHPSLSEGFGLPLIEAAYYNCPVIASNIPVFRELLGDTYLAFDPSNIIDMTEKISSFISNSFISRYRGLEDKCSFSKMAKSTLGLYKNVLV